MWRMQSAIVDGTLHVTSVVVERRLREVDERRGSGAGAVEVKALMNFRDVLRR